jgi:hypothetical protein
MRCCKVSGKQLFGFMILGYCLDCYIRKMGEEVGYLVALFVLKDEDKARARAITPRLCVIERAWKARK